MMIISFLVTGLLLAHSVSGSGKGESCSTDDLNVVLNTEVSVYPSVNLSQTIPLYFGLMVAPSENNDYLNSTVTTVQIALDNINDDANLLGGYSLHYTLTTSQCSENDLVDKTLSQLFGMSGKCRLGLIEAGCTDRRESLARTHLVNHFNISQITCSPTIQDSTDDVSMFEVSPTNDVIVPALVELITHYNWKQLALIVENRQDYSQIMSELVETLNVTLTVTSLSVENHTLKVEDDCDNILFNQDARINVLLMSSELLNHFFCEAYNYSIKYPKYEFILASNHDSDWWVASPQDDLHYGCSTEQRAQVLNYSLALQWRPDYIQPHPWLISNQLKNGGFINKDAAYCYDAVWTLALALNKTLSEFSSYVDCGHSDWSLAIEGLQKHIKETSIDGVTATGRVEFGPKGQRKYARTEVVVKQYQLMMKGHDLSKSFEQVNAGIYSNGNLSLIRDVILWPEGVPYDGSHVTVLVTVSLPLTIVYYLIATAGIILTIACCVFNFAFRNTKIIRLTSPNLNYLIITGTLFIFVSVYWFLIPSTNPDLVLAACCIDIWFFGIGFFLMMGTIVAKLWRIYYIFRNPSSSKKFSITDCHLFMFVLLLVILVTLILLVYTAVETGLPGYELPLVPNEDHLSAVVGKLGVNEHYVFYTCDRVPNSRLITKILLYGIVIILLGCALFMAFKTRKVKIKNLNDAKFITAIVYILSLGTVVHLIISSFFRDGINSFPAVLAGFNMTTPTVILLLVFLPKMINLYRDPSGKHVFSGFDEANHRAPQLSTVFRNNVECAGCLQLLKEVKTLKKSLNQINTNKEKLQDIESREAELSNLNNNHDDNSSHSNAVSPNKSSNCDREVIDEASVSN